MYLHTSDPAIPIIAIDLESDPVLSGLAASLARPAQLAALQLLDPQDLPFDPPTPGAADAAALDESGGL